MLSKDGIPFYEECSFGYYEWFAEKRNDEIVIRKIPMLAPFKMILSDKEYKLEVKYSPEFKNEEIVLDRYKAYGLVREHWKDDLIGRYKGFIKISAKQNCDLNDTCKVNEVKEEFEKQFTPKQLSFL